MVVNQKKNSGYDSYFLYNDNLVSSIPQMESTSTGFVQNLENLEN